MSDGHPRGERLTALRDLQGLTQKDLARALVVSQSFLSQIERGERPLPAELAVVAASMFSLPTSFFTVADGPAGAGEFTFRKKASALMRDERRIKALHVEAARLFHAVSLRSGLQPAILPEPAAVDNDPEVCAELLRGQAGLSPEQPIPNMTRFVERLGVAVIHGLDDASENVSEHTGISRPSRVNDRPLVAVVGRVPGAIQRISVGHELGHLIFDRDSAAAIRGTRSPEEARAYRLAGALLLPADVARRRITESLTLHAYLRIKADYGISVPGILRRAKDLGAISAARYRSLSIQLSSMGWRDQSAEPVPVAQEKPTLLKQAVTRVAGTRSIELAVQKWGIPPTTAARWLQTYPEPTEVTGEVIPLRSRSR